MNNNKYDYYVVGNKGIYYNYFKELLGKEKVFELKKEYIIQQLLNKKIIKKFVLTLFIFMAEELLYMQECLIRNAKNHIYVTWF